MSGYGHHIELGERRVVHKFGNPTPEKRMHTRSCRKRISTETQLRIIPKVKNSYTERHRNGKGSKPRPGLYTQQYRDNFDLIFQKEG
jgi:hypothetical protein